MAIINSNQIKENIKNFVKMSVLYFTLAVLFYSACGEETCDKRLSLLEEEVKALQETLSKTVKSPRYLLEPNGEGVAFYVQLSTDMTHVGNHQTIVFDVVTTNIGNGYNRIDGIFTAPIGGTYVFTWTTTNKNRSYMTTELLKKGFIVLGKTTSDAMDHDDYAIATNSML
ncbi:hypothetical protein MAR_007991 [Mya arenaria]|uniref:C1q domain-containing protein n=1 Tax=Mya arenaria TaxID=6604 RepID=A0ABY7DXR8_MYAAR|nr:hypothetical protein MAR_007991 [Mya arenaria]